MSPQLSFGVFLMVGWAIGEALVVLLHMERYRERQPVFLAKEIL